MSSNEAVTAVVAGMVGEAFAGAPTTAEEKFEFDTEFQQQIVYLACIDQTFMRKVAHLIKPEYFELTKHSALIALVMNFWRKYDSVMAKPQVIAQALKDACASKLLNKEMAREATEGVREVFKEIDAARRGEGFGLNADYIADKVAEFVRQQAVVAAVTEAVELIGNKDYGKIERLVSDAVRIGIEAEEAGGDYFERLRLRTTERAEEQAGLKPPRGITTGHIKLDMLLYHRGFGRKELSVLMGGAKAGKTTALIEFASGAVMAGFNVLYVTLEVSNRIIEERADARFSDTPISDLVGNFTDVNNKIDALATANRCGRFFIAEYPSGTMSPGMLRALLERHKAKGMVYDMVVVDYADIMAPDYRTNDPIENSKQVYIGLRAIAQEWNVAMLTATQSNRDGFKSVTAKAEHVSDDFNKVRTADLFISINSTEEERREGKARLYFAASRNQRSGMTIFIQQDFSRMKFIKLIERVD